MSNSVDQRIVQMRFDNAQFESGVKQSTESLNNLNEALKLDGATKGLTEVQKSADKFNTTKMESSLEAVKNRFSVMGIVGITAIQRLTNAAITAGGRIGNALTEGLVAGGKRRALNLEQANFQLKGLGLTAKEVKTAMDNALEAVKGTAYGLDSAARVGSQLVASGIKVGDNLERSLTAVSGLAAMTGSSYDDIGAIFTTVAGNGRLMSEQLLQFSTRGVNAAATLAKELHKTEAEVREMVTKGEIDFQTFSDAMASAYGEHAKDANKTFEGALSNLNAAMSRIGADFFTPFYESARDLINPLTNVVDVIHDGIAPVLTAMADGMKKVSKQGSDWMSSLDTEALKNTLGTLSSAVLSIVAAFQGIGNFAAQILSPIAESFKEILAPTEPLADIILRIANAFKEFTTSLTVSSQLSSYISNVFYEIFSIVKVLGDVLKDFSIVDAFQGIGNFAAQILSPIAESFKEILAPTEPLADIILRIANAFKEFTASLTVSSQLSSDIGNVFYGIFSIVKMLGAVLKDVGGAIAIVFETIAPYLGIVINLLGNLGKVIGDAINLNKVDFSAFTNFFTKLSELTPSASGLSQAIRDFFEPFLQYAPTVEGLLNVLSAAVNSFSKSLNSFLSNNDVLDESILVLLVYWLRRLIIIVRNTAKDFAAGNFTIFNTINGTLNQLKDTLFALENELNYKGIMHIAEAVLMLAVALLILSSINPDDLSKGLGAVTILLGELAAVMKLLLPNIKDLTGKGGFATMFAAVGETAILYETANALLKLAAAVLILAFGVKMLAELDWQGLAKGLVAVAVILAELGVFTKLMDGTKLRNSVSGVIPLAIGLLILAAAVKVFASMSLNDLATGLISIGVALGIIAGFSYLVKGLKLEAAAPGLLILSFALIGIAASVKILASMSIEQLAKGLISIGLALGIVAAAVQAMPLKITAIGPAMLIMSAALILLASSLAMMGGMSIESIGNSLIVLAGALTILGIAMTAMSSGLAGAAAMLVMAGALAILTPTLVVLGSLSLDQIGVALLALAGAFVVLGVAAVALTPVIPSLVSLAGAIALFGAGVALAGVGLLAFSAGLGALLGLGAATIAGLAGILKELVNVVTEVIPNFVEAGVKLIVEFVAGIASQLPGLVAKGVEMIVTILQGLAEGLPDIITAGIDLVVSFVEGLTQGISENQGRITEAIFGLFEAILSAITDSLATLIDAGAKAVTDILQTITETLTDLGSLDLASIGTGLLALGGAFAELVAAGAALTPVAPTLHTVGEAIKNIGDGCKTTIIYSSQMATSFDKLVASTSKLPSISNNLNTSKKAFDDFSKNVKTSAENVKTSTAAFSSLNVTVSTSSSHMTQLSSATNTLVASLRQIESATSSVTALSSALSEFTARAAATSKQATTLGTSIGANFVSGIRSKLAAARTVGSSLASNAYSGASANNGGWRNLGSYAGQGYVNGIKDWLSAAYKAGGSIANEAKRGNKDAQKSKSPAKEFIALGHYAGEGYVIGLDDYGYAARRSGANLANNAINAMTSILSQIGSAFDNSIESEPTITPVIDMTNVEEGTRAINSMLDIDRTLGISTATIGNIRAVAANAPGNQNGSYNSDLLDAINGLRSDILANPNVQNNYSINGITYDDGSNIASAIGYIANAVVVEGRV